LAAVGVFAVWARGLSQAAWVLDPVSVDTVAPRVQCYTHARHIIVERQFEGSLGSDLFARSRETGLCDADSLSGDLVVRNQWAEYFSGVRGDVLVIDSGTGPDLREVIMIDLRTRRRLLQRSYLHLAPSTDSLRIGLWAGYYLDETAPDCPPPVGGLLPGVDSLFTVNLRTGDVRFAGRTRCAVRQ
jgi:hypothetical protein